MSGRVYYTPVKNKTFIQEDSRTSIGEDFANHIEYYLFKPKLLKNKSQKAYIWIETKFGKDFKLRGDK